MSYKFQQQVYDVSGNLLAHVFRFSTLKHNFLYLYTII